MRPVQLWLPLTLESPYLPEVQRDRERAFRAWNGENTVWLVPGTSASFRWREGPGGIARMVAVDSERLDRLDVYHVLEDGTVWGAGAGERFPNGSVASLLSSALNLFDSSIIRCGAAPEEFVLEVPNLEEGKIKYISERLRLRPLGFMPLEVDDSARRTTKSQWPIEGGTTPTISPTQESRELYGPLESDDSLNTLAPSYKSNKDHSIRAAHLILKMPPPFDKLMPLGAGDDELFQIRTMTSLAKRSVSNPLRALAEAREVSREFVSEGTTRWEMIHFFPILWGRGADAALGLAEDQMDIEHNTLPQLMNDERWQAQLRTPVQVVRTWGITGLLWDLLIDALTTGCPFRACANCGIVIHAIRGRTHCLAQENPDCARSRNNVRQARSRNLRRNSSKRD